MFPLCYQNTFNNLQARDLWVSFWGDKDKTVKYGRGNLLANPGDPLDSGLALDGFSCRVQNKRKTSVVPPVPPLARNQQIRRIEQWLGQQTHIKLSHCMLNILFS